MATASWQNTKVFSDPASENQLPFSVRKILKLWKSLDCLFYLSDEGHSDIFTGTRGKYALVLREQVIFASFHIGREIEKKIPWVWNHFETLYFLSLSLLVHDITGRTSLPFCHFAALHLQEWYFRPHLNAPDCLDPSTVVLFPFPPSTHLRYF